MEPAAPPEAVPVVTAPAPAPAPAMAPGGFPHGSHFKPPTSWPTSRIMAVVASALRGVQALFALIALSLAASISVEVDGYRRTSKFTYEDFDSLKFALGVNVLFCVWALVAGGLTIVQICSPKFLPQAMQWVILGLDLVFSWLLMGCACSVATMVKDSLGDTCDLDVNSIKQGCSQTKATAAFSFLGFFLVVGTLVITAVGVFDMRLPVKPEAAPSQPPPQAPVAVAIVAPPV